MGPYCYPGLRWVGLSSADTEVDIQMDVVRTLKPIQSQSISTQFNPFIHTHLLRVKILEKKKPIGLNNKDDRCNYRQGVQNNTSRYGSNPRIIILRENGLLIIVSEYVVHTVEVQGRAHIYSIVSATQIVY